MTRLILGLIKEVKYPPFGKGCLCITVCIPHDDLDEMVPCKQRYLKSVVSVISTVTPVSYRKCPPDHTATNTVYRLLTCINQYGLSHPYHLDESIFIFCGINSNSSFLFHFLMKIM